MRHLKLIAVHQTPAYLMRLINKLDAISKSAQTALHVAAAPLIQSLLALGQDDSIIQLRALLDSAIIPKKPDSLQTTQIESACTFLARTSDFTTENLREHLLPVLGLTDTQGAPVYRIILSFPTLFPVEFSDVLMQYFDFSHTENETTDAFWYFISQTGFQNSENKPQETAVLTRLADSFMRDSVLNAEEGPLGTIGVDRLLNVGLIEKLMTASFSHNSPNFSAFLKHILSQKINPIVKNNLIKQVNGILRLKMTQYSVEKDIEKQKLVLDCLLLICEYSPNFSYQFTRDFLPTILDQFDPQTFKHREMADTTLVHYVTENDAPIHFTQMLRRTPESEHIHLFKSRDRTANTPFHIACRKGFSSKAAQLLFSNADPFVKNVNGDTSFHLAFRGQFMEIVATLLEIHPDLLLVQNNNKETALMEHIADKKSSAAVIRFLTPVKPELLQEICKQRNTDGLGLVHLCAKHNLSTVLHLLIPICTHNNISLLSADTQHENPAHFAVEQNHDSILAVIPPHYFISPNSTDQSPLFLAVKRGRTRSVELMLTKLRQLSSKEMIPDTITHDEFLLKHILTGSKTTVELALSVLKKLNILDEYLHRAHPKTGATPFHLSAYRGAPAVMKSLLDFEPNDKKRPNPLLVPDDHGSTPLHHAARNGHHRTLNVMLDRYSTEINDTLVSICSQPLNPNVVCGNDLKFKIDLHSLQDLPNEVLKAIIQKRAQRRLAIPKS